MVGPVGLKRGSFFFFFLGGKSHGLVFWGGKRDDTLVFWEQVFFCK